MPVDVKYSTRATAKGGRDGSARSEDGRVDVKLSTPKELGGAGGPGTNPEQLFAAGYSACFIGSMKVAGGQLKIKVPDDTTVTATVGIGPRSEGGFRHHGRTQRYPAWCESRAGAEAGRDCTPDLPLLQRNPQQS